VKTEVMVTEKGEISVCQLDSIETIKSSSDFLNAIMNCSTDTIVLRKEDLAGEFFDLKTKLAGDCLQKISNYHKRLIILGDFKENISKSLNDFIYESNKRGQVIFSKEITEAIELLR
jgi:hypothetical protein